jgi:hyaluronoglucosaminidase
VTRRTESPFAVRGVIEGFYGRPWSHAQRLELVEFIAHRGMNTFVYAPKDDPLVRRHWRLPYSGSDLERLSELAATCRDHGVELVYCLSPGLSIRYSGDEDLDALGAKFDSVAGLGVGAFGLLLDDIPRTLQHESDRRAFDDLSDAHATLIGRLFDRFPAGRRLVVCPTIYSGYGDEDYIRRLGRAIDPRIDLFWTGRQICSPTLDLFDAATFARATGRPATYWDNYPVNDVAMRHELHVGPYRGRDRHLWRFARGVIANPMELFESSKIPLATVADYLRDPEGYHPEESWRSALRDVVGEADLDAFALFADNVRSSALAVDDAPIVTAALETFAFESEYGAGPGPASRELGELADRMLAAGRHLLRGDVENSSLIDEARPWIEAFETGAEAIRRIADLAADDRLVDDGPRQLLPYLHRLRESRLRVFGDVLDMTLDDLTRAPATVLPTGANRGGTT